MFTFDKEGKAAKEHEETKAKKESTLAAEEGSKTTQTLALKRKEGREKKAPVSQEKRC